ncbi:MAG: PCRF domain-containing protein [Crenarchaeota archaeon]|nr:PCRF domain-containing protein [Thermoproteota archaeon]
MDKINSMDKNPFYETYLHQKQTQKISLETNNLTKQNDNDTTSKSSKMKLWGGLLIGAAGLGGAGILLVKRKKALDEKKIQHAANEAKEKIQQAVNETKENIETLSKNITDLGDKLKSKKERLIFNWAEQKPESVRVEILLGKSTPLENLKERLKYKEEWLISSTKTIQEYTPKMKERVRPLFKDPEIKGIRDFRRKIDIALKDDIKKELENKSLVESGKPIKFQLPEDLSERKNALFTLRTVAYGLIKGKIEKAKYPENSNVPKILEKIKQSKNMSIDEILQLFSHDLQKVKTQKGVKSSPTTFAEKPLDRQIKSLKKNLEQITGNWDDLNIIKDRKAKKELTQEIPELKKAIEDFKKFETEELPLKLENSEENKALQDAKAKLAVAQARLKELEQQPA